MALRWAWDFGLGLPTVFYENSSDWGVTGGSARVDTASTSSLVSPAGAGTPGEQFNCKISGTTVAGQLFTPQFPGAAVTQGWFVDRWRIASTISNSAAVNIIDLWEGGSKRVTLRGDLSGNPVPLELFVNGTSVGTTTSLIGDAASYVLAIDFNMTAVPPQAGLVVDGTREIALGSGSGTATQITHASLGSGSSSNGIPGYHGCLLLFDSLADTRGMNPNYWGTGLNADAVSNDVSWSIFGGAASKLAAISDRDETTGVETTTTPDSITVGFENTTDILAGWSPSTILMVVGVAVGSADVINTTTVDLSDGVGSAGTDTEVLTATPSTVIVYAELNSTAGAWTASEVNAATYDYDVV